MLLASCLLLLASSLVLAQSGGGYDLSWSTVDGGGYSLGGGFWGGGAGAAPGYLIYLPLVVRSQ
jgi:hypothetical protein